MNAPEPIDSEATNEANNEAFKVVLAIAVGLALAALPFFQYTYGQRHHHEDGAEHVHDAAEGDHSHETGQEPGHGHSH